MFSRFGVSPVLGEAGRESFSTDNILSAKKCGSYANRTTVARAPMMVCVCVVNLSAIF